MDPVMFWQIAACTLYVLGAVMCHAWAWADGRIESRWAFLYVTIWPIFVLVGTVWGIYHQLKRRGRRGR